ncbi:MerR family transcriptional regulator, partial [Pseudomonas aeruginosa]
MKIGELATRTGAAVETIRFYEAEGLLQASARAENNYRSYSDEHKKRLLFLLRCRSLDMAHDEIRALLELQDDSEKACGEVDGLLPEHRIYIDDRIAELIEFKRQIIEIRSARESS